MLKSFATIELELSGKNYARPTVTGEYFRIGIGD